MLETTCILFSSAEVHLSSSSGSPKGIQEFDNNGKKTTTIPTFCKTPVNAFRGAMLPNL